MPYSASTPSEWCAHVTIDGDEHRILVVADTEHSVHRRFAEDHARGGRIRYDVQCHEADQTGLTVEWGNVQSCTVGDVEWVRTWGPQGEIRVRPQPGQTEQA